MKKFILLLIISPFLKLSAQPVWYPSNSLNQIDPSIIDIRFVNDQLGYGITAQNVYYKTISSGAYWEKKKIPLLNNRDSIFTDIIFVNEKVGFANTGFSTYQTKNGGDTWERFFLGVYPVFDIQNGEFYAYGDQGFGSLFVTKYFPQNDSFSAVGGGFWPIYSITNLKWIKDSTLIITKDTGRIYMSNDLGKTYTMVYDADSGVQIIRYIKVLSMHFKNEDTGYAHFSDNSMAQTTDGGQNWITIQKGNKDFFRSKFVESHGKIYLGAEQRGAFITYNDIFSIENKKISLDTSTFTYETFSTANILPSPILGANSQSLFAHMLLSDPFDTSQKYRFIVKSINKTLKIEKLGSRNFNIYPNPAQNLLHFRTISGQFPIAYNIYSLQGKEMLKGLIRDNQSAINIGELKAGMYILQTNQGQLKFIQE